MGRAGDAAAPGGKMNILNEKKIFDFLPSTKAKIKFNKCYFFPSTQFLLGVAKTTCHATAYT
jgi:hypothetical protein